MTDSARVVHNHSQAERVQDGWSLEPGLQWSFTYDPGNNHKLGVWTLPRKGGTGAKAGTGCVLIRMELDWWQAGAAAFPDAAAAPPNGDLRAAGAFAMPGPVRDRLLSYEDRAAITRLCGLEYLCSLQSVLRGLYGSANEATIAGMRVGRVPNAAPGTAPPAGTAIYTEEV